MTACSSFRLHWLLLSEWKLVSLRHRNQSCPPSLGEVSDGGGHPARSPEARQQADEQWPHLGLWGLQRAGVGEWFCEYPSRGQCRRWIWRVCQSCPRHPLWGRLGLWPKVGRPGQIVSSTKGDVCCVLFMSKLTSFLPDETEMYSLALWCCGNMLCVFTLQDNVVMFLSNTHFFSAFICQISRPFYALELKLTSFHPLTRCSVSAYFQCTVPRWSKRSWQATLNRNLIIKADGCFRSPVLYSLMEMYIFHCFGENWSWSVAYEVTLCF